MKFIIIFSQLFFAVTALSQRKEFSTFFALEDAAGRKDTIWYEAKVNANNNEIDPGEVKIEEPLDSNLMFLTVSGDDFLYNPIYLKNRIVHKSATNYGVSFGLIFIDVKFPVKIIMDRSFLNGTDELHYMIYKLYNDILSVAIFMGSMA